MPKIVSYNILAQKCCDGQREFDPEKNKERRIHLANKLVKWMSENAIICLQEVTQSDLTLIINLCSKNEYLYVHAFHGNFFNDYFGEMTLFSKKTEFKVEIIKLTDYIRARKMTVSEKQLNYLTVKKTLYDYYCYYVHKKINSYWGSFFTLTLPWYKKKQADLKKVMYKYNKVVIIDFGDYKVMNYHMPLFLKQPIGFSLHLKGLINLMRYQQNKRRAVFLAADLNIKHRDLEKTLGYYPDVERVKIDKPTCITTGWRNKKTWSTEPIDLSLKISGLFKETIDHFIYVTNEKLMITIDQPIEFEYDVDLPDLRHAEPSDHLPISFTFEFDDSPLILDD